MNVIQAERPETQTAPAARDGIAWWFTDIWLMAQRNLRRILRSPDVLVMYAVVQPVMFILLFVFVFGGAIQVPGGDYTQFFVPGIFVQMIVFTAVAIVTVGVAEDMQRGVMDRFRSLPMSRASILIGRVTSEVLRNLIALAVMVVCGLVIGFRFQGDLGQILGGFALLLLFGFSFSWLGAVAGLLLRSVEAAQSGMLAWLFPFAFISSIYVPVESMPGWLQAYAAHSPVTLITDTLRAWFNGQDAGSSPWLSAAWSVGMVLVLLPIAVVRLRRLSS
ncbi:ABC transporter permease [Nocardiopsis sp. CA-288880]|jgi:ABC transporter DrrB family efflux protein|uniref:ABC transporter permease n=1 Tax=Nocardiopsis sp. CA-288880 TaxID=3239995 RepID=UPI003D96668F